MFMFEAALCVTFMAAVGAVAWVIVPMAIGKSKMWT